MTLFCFLVIAGILSTNGWTFSSPPAPRHNSDKTVATVAAASASTTATATATRKAFLKSAAVTAATVVVATGAPDAALATTTDSRPPATTTTTTSSSSYYQPPSNSLNGQVIIITGGTTGLGLESAKRLSLAGATVVLTARSQDKGNRAVRDVQEYLLAENKYSGGDNGAVSGGSKKKNNKNNNVCSLVLDLDDLRSVKSFPAAYKKLGLGSINVLMNNAGVMAIPDRQVTKDGYERTFQSNHLGHFVLTAGLFPYFSRESTTVINVSSSGYQFAKDESANQQGLDLNNLNGETQYGPWSSYGLTKLANILFTQELQRRADTAAAANDSSSPSSSWLTAVSLHPGAVQTDLPRNMMGEEKWNNMRENGLPPGLEGLMMKGMANFIKTIPDGASTQIYLAAANRNDNDDDKGDNNKTRRRPLEKAAFYENLKVKRNLPAFATDPQKAQLLWEQSEALGGITFRVTS